MRRVIIIALILLISLQIVGVSAVESDSSVTPAVTNPIPYWGWTYPTQVIFTREQTVQFWGVRHSDSVYVACSGIGMTTGTYHSGTLTSVQSSDDIYYIGKRSNTGTVGVQTTFYAPVSPEKITSVTLSIEWKYSIEGEVEINLDNCYFAYRNYITMSWAGFQLRSIDTTDTIQTYSVPETGWEPWTGGKTRIIMLSYAAFVFYGSGMAYTYWDHAFLTVMWEEERENTLIIPLLEKNPCRITVLSESNNSAHFELYLGERVWSRNISEAIRIQIEVKTAISLWRATVYTATGGVMLERSEGYSFNRGGPFYVTITAGVGTLVTLYGWEGDIDFTEAWQWSSSTSSVPNNLDDKILKMEMLAAGSGDWSYTATHEIIFSSFQYWRSFADVFIKSEISSLVSLESRVIFSIGSTTISIKLYFSYDGSTRKLHGLVSVNGSLLHEEQNAYTSSGILYAGRVKLWRSLDNRLGIAISSNNKMFRDSSDTRTSTEEFTRYYFSIGNNWSGSVRVCHNWIKAVATGLGEEKESLTATNPLYYVDFGEAEYELWTPAGCAEPHFSTTWWSAVPFFGPLLNWLFGTGGPFGATFDPIAALQTYIFEPLLNLLSPISAGIDVIVSILGAIASDILSGVESIFISIFGNLIDLITDFINSFIYLINDIIINLGDWFLEYIVPMILLAFFTILETLVNMLGSLFGIVGLYTSLATFIVSGANGINGIVATITALFNMFSGFLLYFATNILPMAPYFLNLVVLFAILDIVAVIAFGTVREMEERARFYVGIIDKIFTFVWRVVELFIRIIAELIPL